MTTPDLSLSPAHLENSTTNGTFLANIEASAAAISPLAPAVHVVAREYIDEGGLGYVLRSMQQAGRAPLVDDWQNTALNGLESGTTLDGFNDGTSGGGSRSREDYLARISFAPSVENPLNVDPTGRFPGYRPLGFEIAQDQQPVMAVVALDPARLDTGLGDGQRAILLDEVRHIRLAAGDNDRAVREAAASQMSPALREVLSSCLLANDTFVNTRNSDGSTREWSVPFDLIASMKAMYTLLSGEQISAAMRQGAVRMQGADGLEIIVGCSGLNSAIDEMVARNFAQDVLNAASQAHS